MNKESLPVLLPPAVGLAGSDRTIRTLERQVAKVAAFDVPVVLQGEPGTGRQAVARHIHALSPRSAEPFVAVAAGSLLDDAAILLHGKADAAQPGKYQQAAGGCLFIAGLEELLPAAQRTLLADIKNGYYLPAGAAQSQQLDVRFMSSTLPTFGANGDGHFRADLWHSLSGIILHVPPVREYADDLPHLLNDYIGRLVDAGLPFRRFSKAAERRLREYSWPGNLAEAQNLVRRLLLSDAPEEISEDEIERHLPRQSGAEAPLSSEDLLSMPLREAREQFERVYLYQQLLISNGKVDEFAKRMGMDVGRAYAKVQALELLQPLRKAREEFERIYLQQQLAICNGKVEEVAKRAGMEKTHLYRKLKMLGLSPGNKEE